MESALAKKEKLPIETVAERVPRGIHEDDIDVPAFIRRRKPEVK